VGEYVLVRLLLGTGIFVLSCCTAHAAPVTLGGDAAQRAVVGKTVHLDTPLGVAIPITYHANGIMSGKAGVLEYFLGAEADRGRWWIAHGKLCQKWFKWLDAQPSFMRLQQDGNKIFWRRDDGVSGTAHIVAGLPLGAESAPRALGGPIRALPATETTKDVAKAALRPETRPSVPPPRSKKYGTASPGHGIEATGPAQEQLWPQTALNGDTVDWCQSPAHRRKAEPHTVAIQLTAGWITPTHACFAEAPGLQEVARLGVSIGRSLD
jgi:hypothetical protein